MTGAPPLDAAITHALEPFAAAPGNRLLDLSPDGTTVLVATGSRVATVDVATNARRDRGGWPGVTAAACVAADCSTAVIDVDPDRDEQLRLVRVAADGARTAVSGEPGRQASPVYDAAHDALAWTLVRPGAAATELWLSEGAAAPRPLATVPGEWTTLGFYAGTVIVRHDRGAMQARLFWVDPVTGALHALTADTGVDAPYAAAGSPWGLLALEVGAAEELHSVRPIDQPHLTLSAHGREVDGLAATADGAVLSSDEDGASRLWRVARSAHVATPLENPEETAHVITDLRAHAHVTAYTRSDPQHPRDVGWVDGAMPARLLAGADPTLPRLVEPTLEHTSAPGGPTFAMWVYRPSAGAGPAPVVVDFHGGPEDEWRPRYAPFEQFLASRGYAIVQPNVRGSSGAGRTFALLDDGRGRADVLADVDAVLDWIATQPDLDPSRVVVMGFSYGGFLALASVLAMPDRIVGAIDLAGMTDLPAFLAGTAAYRRANRRAEYGDERDPAARAYLAALSPITHVDSLRRPILVAHGRRDPRVPYADVERFIARARAAGHAVWSIIADDEGHGFARSDNRGAFEVLAAQFLDAVTRCSERPGRGSACPD